MEIVLLDQTRVFVYAAFLGLCLGLVYDVFSFFPDTFGQRVLRPVFDILYCLVFMAAFIALVLLRAGGEIRWYIPGGMILGLVLYFVGFSQYIRLLLRGARRGMWWLGKGLRQLFGWLEKLFEAPRGN